MPTNQSGFIAGQHEIAVTAQQRHDGCQHGARRFPGGARVKVQQMTRQAINGIP
jgi:hypothetical protein